MSTLTLNFPDPLSDLMSQWARESGQSQDVLVVAAVQEYLADIADAKEAEQRLANLDAGLTRTRTLAEVEQALGLAN